MMMATQWFCAPFHFLPVAKVQTFSFEAWVPSMYLRDDGCLWAAVLTHVHEFLARRMIARDSIVIIAVNAFKENILRNLHVDSCGALVSRLWQLLTITYN